MFESPSLADKLRKEIERLESRLQPAHENEIKTSLAKLILHYPMTNMTQHEKTLLLEDYIKELSTFAANIIDDVCREYKLNPEHQFFPKEAILISACKVKTFVLRRKISVLEKALEDAKNVKPEARMTIQEMDSIKARLMPLQPEWSI